MLELRPPVSFDKGQAVRDMVERADVRAAMYGGDDTTDLDAFDALSALIEEGRLDAAVRVGVGSEEGPRQIVERADLVVDGVRGLHAGAGGAGRVVRFRDLLRVSVLLFGGTATALAVVSVVGAADEDTNTLVYVAAVWWCVASLAGFWLGRRVATTPGDRARCSPTRAPPTRCPSSSPGRCCSTGSGR